LSHLLRTWFEEHPATGGPGVRRTRRSMQASNQRRYRNRPTPKRRGRIRPSPSAWIALLSYANLAGFATFSGRYVVGWAQTAAVEARAPGSLPAPRVADDSMLDYTGQASRALIRPATDA
jgi:hypothetical protein